MNKLMIFCLLLALAVPVLAVDDGRVMYAGGTVPALPAGAVGRLDTTSEESLTFEYSIVLISSAAKVGVLWSLISGRSMKSWSHFTG